MIKNDFFTFLTNVSLDNYRSKDEVAACVASLEKARAYGKEKLAFHEMTVSVRKFLELATNGYAFCNLFDYGSKTRIKVKNKNGTGWKKVSPVYRTGRNKGCMKLFVKSDKYFKGAQTVFVDVDYTQYQEVPDYLEALTLPTCVYMSFSDKQQKGGRVSRRFRLVYVFDKILDKKEFNGISHIISHQIEIDTDEVMDDDCGTRRSQYMNGVWGNNEVYCSNIIYSVSDFPGWDEISIKEDAKIEYDECMTWQMENLTYQEFMHKNSWRGYIYQTEKSDWIDGLYQVPDENYLCLYYCRNKVQDGGHRRKKLFKNACLRLLMCPDMDPDKLLFNLYVDRERFFDNSDGVITIDCLKRRATKALRMTHQELTEYCQLEIDYFKNRRKFIVKPGKGIKTTLGFNRSIRKQIRWEETDARYDQAKSVKENFDAGIGIPLSSLYRYAHDREIPTNPSKNMTKREKIAQKRLEKENNRQLFMSLYDPNMSIRQNQAMMEQHGLHLSRGTIDNYVKKYFPKSGLSHAVDAPKYEAPQFDSWQSNTPSFNTPDYTETQDKAPIPRYKVDTSYKVPTFDYLFNRC